MSERIQAVLLLALFLLLTAALTPVVGTLAMFVAGAIALLGHALQRWAVTRNALQPLDQIVTTLLPIDDGRREVAIARLATEEERAYVRAALAAEGVAERHGVVVRHPYPRAIQRRAAAIYWACWALAVVTLSLAALVRTRYPALVRGSALGLGVLGAAGAVLARRRERHYRTALERAPHRLTEVHPDGTRVTLYIAGVRAARMLRPDPITGYRRRRIFLSPWADGRGGIVIDGARVNGVELLEAVIAWAEERSAGGANAAAAAPGAAPDTSDAG